jgi:hypothetical protein
VEVDLLVIGYVGRPVRLEPGRGLGEGLVEVHAHHLAHGVERPGRVGLGQELGDLVGIRLPAVMLGGDGGRIAGLGRGHEVCRDEDALAEQLGEGVTRWLAVEPGDGRAVAACASPRPERWPSITGLTWPSSLGCARHHGHDHRLGSPSGRQGRGDAPVVALAALRRPGH